MKFTKKCDSTQYKISKSNRRRSSAGMFYTSSAGAVTSLILMVALCGIINLFNSTSTYADDPSISLSVSDISLNFMPTSSAPTFSESSSASIVVSTTSASGYTLSIASSTGSTNLTSGSNTISSISSVLTSSQFSSGNSYLNQWGYKPSSVYDSSTEQNVANTSFRPLPDDAGEIIAKTNTANSTADTYSLSIGAKVNNATPTGEYVSDTFIVVAVTNAVTCSNTRLCVEYNSNGLTYSNGDTLNIVNYSSAISQTPTVKHAHTSNIDDTGAANIVYPTGNVGLREIVSIPGASSLTVTLSYSIEENWDYLYVFTGEYTGNITGSENTPMSAGQDYTLTGGTGTTSGSNSTTFTIIGDTVTFALWSDTATSYYGYYATVTGYGYARTVTSGEYAIPTGTNAIFRGWSSTQTTAGEGLASQVEYTDEPEAITNIPGNNGDIVTLYAVWQHGQVITFTKNNNLTNIDILDSDGNTVGSIASSGQSLLLAQGSTYTIKAPGGRITSATISSGAGTIGTIPSSPTNKVNYTVGQGSATISINGAMLPDMQSFASSSCTTSGNYVYDNRDEEIYLVKKLANNKCYMLDNLRLDLTDSTVLSGLTPTNTNADTASLTSLRLGNRSAGAKYANGGFSVNFANYYNRARIFASDKDVTTTNYGPGSGKVGVYYNYCAASAGSYCYDKGAGSGNASYDLCPAGWRMPGGGFNTGEYYDLYKAYGQNNANFRSALSATLSGTYSNWSDGLMVKNRGLSTYYWTYTIDTTYANSMSALFFNSSDSVLFSTNNRLYGDIIRCVKK